MSDSVTKEDLKQYLDRIEALEKEKLMISEDIKNYMIEAKMKGINLKAFRQLLKIRKTDKQELEEQENILDYYRSIMNI